MKIGRDWDFCSLVLISAFSIFAWLLYYNFVSLIFTFPRTLINIDMNLLLYATIVAVLLVLVLTEIIFWVCKDKPRKNESKMEFTFIMKGTIAVLAYGIMSIVLATLSGIVLLIKAAIENYQTTLRLLGEIGTVFAVIVGVTVAIFIFIKLNSLKYN